MIERKPLLRQLISTSTTNWERRTVYPKVDKPPVILTDAGEYTHPEPLYNQTQAFVKEKEIDDPIRGKIVHEMHVQVGEKVQNNQEYYIHYSCTYWDNPIERIDLIFTNRDAGSERRLRNNIFFTQLETKKTPKDELGDVSQSRYFFNEKGICDVQEVAIYDKSEYGDRPKYMLFGKYVRRGNPHAHAHSQIDVSLQKLDAMQTIQNLFDNIASDIPKSPLDCLAVKTI